MATLHRVARWLIPAMVLNACGSPRERPAPPDTAVDASTVDAAPDGESPPDADPSVTEVALVCDGVTNDTAALNAALQAAAGSGATLLLPAGTCVVGGASPVHVPSGVTVRGRGRGGASGTVLLAAPQITRCASNPSAVCAVIQIGGDGQGSASNVRIAELELDAGGFADIGSAAISFNSGTSHVTIDDISITHMPQYGIVVAGADHFTITNSSITKSDHPVNGSGLYSQIQAINVVASEQSTAGEISHCTFTGAGLDIAATSTTISDNTIQNWTFGAGITTEQSPFCHDLVISGNTVTGGIGLDVNQTVALGIEQWCASTTVSGNTVFGNAGDGINIGGKNNTVSSNIVHDNGTYAHAFSGITARWGNDTYNASGAVFSFNSSYNTAGTSGPQEFGYNEQSAQLSGIVLFDCSFDTNRTAATSIQSASTINSSLWASPCSLGGSPTCTSNITWWASSSAGSVDVYVSNSGSPAAFSLMASGPSGQAQAPWIQNLTYYFQLRSSHGTLGTLPFAPH